MPTLNTIFTNQTADADAAPFNCTGGPVVVFVNGTFDGAKVKMQYSLDDGANWFDDDVFFAGKSYEETVPPVNSQMRLSLQDSTATTDVSAKVYK